MRKITLLCLLLALLTIVPLCFSACVDTPEKPSETTGQTVTAESVTTQELLIDNLPDNIKFEDYTFRMLGQGGSGWTASDIIIPEDGNTGDIYNDTIYLRYEMVKERFGLEAIESTLVENVYVTVQAAMRSGDKSFDIIDMDTVNTFTATTNSMLYDLKKLEYIDLSMPYYDQNYIHDMSVGDRLFSVVTDITTMDTHCMWIMMYNKVMLAKHDLEDPYDLVKANKWTLDKFNSMLANVSKDNGDNKWDDYDTYGFSAHIGSARNFYYACGMSICTKDKDTDLPVLSIINPTEKEKLTKVCEEVTDILYSDNKTLLGGKIIEAFEQGRSLFLAEIAGYLGRFREMEDNFGVCPYPMIDDKQTRYYTTNDPCIMVFSIPAFSYTQEELERVSIIFEGLCSASYITVRPAYYVDVLGGQQSRDYKSYEMLNLCKESRVYDFGLFNDVGTLRSLFSDLCNTKNPNIESTISRSQKSATKKLNQLLTKFEQIGKD